MKLGVIGTSEIVKVFLQGALRNDFEFEAVYSRKEETGEAFRNELDGKKTYTSLERMLEDEAIEIVYVASPNSLHFEHSLLALKHGKHVITEKPFTSTLEEIDVLIKEAKQRRLFLFEAITTIHLPNYKQLKEKVKEIGQIRLVQCNFSQYSRKYDALLSGEIPNVFNPKFSGGALVDINIYNLHFVMNLFNKPTEIHYSANLHQNGIDTSGVLVLKYDDFICELVGAKDTRSINFAIIQGEKGYIHVDGTSGCRNVKMVLGNDEVEYQLQEDLNPLYYECVDFNRMIKESNFDECYELLNHSRAVIEVMVKARKDAGIVFEADHHKPLS